MFKSSVASQAIFPHYPETEARLEDLPKENITPKKVDEKCLTTNVPFAKNL